MPLSYDDISGLLKIIDSSSCEELILETSDIRLVVRKRTANGAQAPGGMTYQGGVQTPSDSAKPLPAPSPSTAAADDAQNSAGIVRAPMLGTFYRAPSPEAPPFVEVGSVVKKGDPLCVIEVMKLFTTVHADCSGRVVEIGAENACLVEYGQPLFVIALDGNAAREPEVRPG